MMYRAKIRIQVRFLVLIHGLLPLGSFFMWTVDQGELRPWCHGQWGPFAYAKRWADSGGLAALPQQAGPIPQLVPGAGQECKAQIVSGHQKKKSK